MTILENRNPPGMAGFETSQTDGHGLQAKDSLAAAAGQLAAAGWRVHPLRPGSKLPLLTGWPALATNDAATVAAWWTATPAAGIGIATGGNLFVLDVDTSGKPGFESLRALEAAHGTLPPTLAVTTASGGRHLYFASAEPIRNSAGRIGAGLDVRGAGGYVVAPPTAIDGRAYRWELSPIAPAPAWLVRLALAAAPVADGVSAGPVAVEPTPELVADLRDALHAIPADNRGDWIATGAALRPLGEAGRALWLEWSAKSAKHDAERDPAAWETIGHDNTGPGAIFAAAQRNGWQNPAARRRAAAVFGAGGVGALRLVDVSHIERATIRPPRFIVERIVPRGHLTLLGGHGGAGKSILALSLAAHTAAGAAWAGLAVEGGPALFVSGEDGADLLRFRLRKVIAATGLDADAVTSRLRIIDATAAGALMVEHSTFGTRSLAETVALAELRALVADAVLIVIDNASDAFDGNENARQQVRAFVRTLADLGRPNDAAVLLLAHIDKNAARYGSAGNSYSGSSAWHNSARSRLALIESRGAIELRHEKSNLGPKLSPLRMTWIDGGVLVPLSGTAGDPAADDAAAVLAAITAAVARGVDVPAARRGSGTAQKELETVPELPERLRGVQGRDAFWAAIAKLQDAGKIVVEEFTDGNRNRKKKFALR